MKIPNNNLNVNFSSKIRLIPQDQFNDKVKHLNRKKHFVGFPWTVKTGKSGKNLYTTNIMDCICVAIIGKPKADLYHICTYNQSHAKKNKQEGFNINDIERRIMDKIDPEDENVHAFILGGFQLEDNSKHNVLHLNKIKKIFDKYKIPYSIIGARRNVHYFGKYSLLYDNKEDTVYITNSLTNSPKLNGEKGNELVIDKDNVMYYTYKKNMDYYGVYYKKEFHTGTTKDFLDSQFRMVSLCKFDEFA